MSQSKDRLPSRLSPSRAKDFMQCPRLFYYKTILKLPSPGSVHTLRGTLAHTAFERIFDHPVGERNVETAVAYVRPAWSVMSAPRASRTQVDDALEIKLRDAAGAWDDTIDELNWEHRRLLSTAEEALTIVAQHEGGYEDLVATAEEMVRRWYAMENPNKFTPRERELEVEAKIGSFSMFGYIDRLDAFGEGPEQSWYISDYKTGSVPKDQYLDEAFFAMWVYALLLRESKGIRAEQLRLVYVKEGSRDAIKTAQVTDEGLARTSKQVKAVWKGIQSCAERDEWAPKTGPLCPWCPFQDICPAFGGKTLEGLLPEERLEP